MTKERKILISLISISIIICIFRIISIFFVRDVFSDEDVIIKHIISIRQSGKDYYGESMPAFSKVGAGLTTYTYLYPMIFFSLLLGSVNAIKLRIIQQLLTISACLLTSFAIKRWFNNKKLFWVCLFTSLTLPWGFVQANRIWDPSFVPLYFSIAFYFYVLLIKRENKEYQKYIFAILYSSFTVLLAIVYPPCRIPAVFMWIYMTLYAFIKKKINWIILIVIIVTSTLLSLPLAIKILTDSEFNQRSKDLLVFKDVKFYQGLYQWGKNTINQFRFDYLFYSGDWIYRHSLPIFGMLGTISIIPLIYRIYKRDFNKLDLFLFLIILFTNLSAGLTNDYSPHSLRACLCWICYAIIIAQGWDKITNIENKKIKYTIYSVTSISFIIYFTFFCLIEKGILEFHV
jgi:4-amino-4-deoxy-L-arabinose transferase-like glycosyltransferase